MAESTSPSRIPCGVGNCAAEFVSQEEVLKHQARYHITCYTCNVKFETRQDHFVHKLLDNKHIICPICGLDFSSEGGRDTHIQNNHKRDQKLICPGCKSRHRSAAAMIRHIEEDACEGFTRMRLQAELKRCSDDKDLLRLRYNEVQDSGRGLLLDAGDMGTREAMLHQPQSGDESASQSETALISLRHWPTLGPSVPVDTIPTTTGSTSGPPAALVVSSSASSIRDALSLNLPSLPLYADDLLVFDELGPQVVPAKPAAKAPPQPSWRRIPLPDTIVEEEPLGNPHDKMYFRRRRWDPQAYTHKNPGQYTCPCGTIWKTVDEFHRHITVNMTEVPNICPRCHKAFGSTSALVAHMESSSRSKCAIRLYDDFNDYIERSTGGLIQVEDYHEDGTARLVARDLETLDRVAVWKDPGERSSQGQRLLEF